MYFFFVKANITDILETPTSSLCHSCTCYGKSSSKTSMQNPAETISPCHHYHIYYLSCCPSCTICCWLHSVVDVHPASLVFAISPLSCQTCKCLCFQTYLQYLLLSCCACTTLSKGSASGHGHSSHEAISVSYFQLGSRKQVRAHWLGSNLTCHQTSFE